MINYKSKNFTLVELLVVVTIISILVSILIPLLSKARYKASITLCASAQKQNTTALIMYTDDHDGRLPDPTNFNQPQYYRYFYNPDKDEYKSLGKLYENQSLKSYKESYESTANLMKSSDLEVFHITKEKSQSWILKERPNSAKPA